MEIKQYIRLRRKSVQRDNETLYITNGLVAIVAGVVGYFGSGLIGRIDTSSFFMQDMVFIITCYGLLINDFTFKLQYKQNFTFPALVKCIPDSNKLYLPYYVFKETTSIWNLYLPVFFLFPVFRVMLPLHGIATSVMLFAGVYFLTLLVSNVVFYVNMETKKMLWGIFFLLLLSVMIFLFYVSLISVWKWLLGLVVLMFAGLNGYFVTGNTKLMKYHSGQEDKVRLLVFQDKMPLVKRSPFFLYLSLHIRMILRSSVLRRQFFVFILLTMIYLINIITESPLMDNFSTRFFLAFFVLLVYPLSQNATIFSAGGAFFDRLVLSPSFRSFLTSRYRENVAYTSILFIILLFFYKSNVDILYGLIAVFFYCSGLILSLSFLSIFFANKKTDFSSYSKAWTTQPGIEVNLFMLGLLIVTLSVVLLINSVFSEQVANHFMLFTGLTFGIFSHKWLKILYQYYMKHTKYKQMENFRKQETV